MNHSDCQNLKQWFLEGKRIFPWREEPSPYRVWISEIMLQQTRASVVVTYFSKWMARFPTLSDVAKTSEEELIKLWEGLGYYNRVRNIQKAARYILENHGGAIPSTLEELIKVPGLGPYTAGAILSFAFHQKAAAVDGNVARVISRYYQIEEDITRISTQKVLKDKTLAFLPDKDPWVVMEALIELGATVCGKTPMCEQCPLHDGCKGHETQSAHLLPIKKKRKETLFLSRMVPIIRCEQSVLVRQLPMGKVLGGLYEFPSFDLLSLEELSQQLQEKFNIEAHYVEELPMQEYGFTHHHVELFPHIWDTSSQISIAGYTWKSIAELTQLPFTSGHKRILAQLLT